MRVLVIGGHIECVKSLAQSEGVELFVLAPQRALDCYREAYFSGRLFPYVSKAKLDIRAIRQTRRVIETVRPDVVHAYYGRALTHAILATSWMTAPPKIVSFRGIDAVASRFDPGNLISYLHPRVAGHACESDAVRRAMIDSGISPERCVTTYNCIRPGSLSPAGREALAPWDVPEDAFVLGTVATIRRVKGIDILLQAADACADIANLYVVLIGTVADRRQVRLAANSRLGGRVKVLGFQRRASRLISGADLFVMPSRREALCRALLEAMSQGVCPIVSDAGGMKEVVRHGRDGLVVPREDPAALAAAIRALYEDRSRREAYAASAQQRCAEEFCPKKMAERTLKLYHRVIDRRAASAA